MFSAWHSQPSFCSAWLSFVLCSFGCSLFGRSFGFRELNSGPVHGYPDIFESATFSFRTRLPSTRILRILQRIRVFLNQLSRVEKKIKSTTSPITCGRVIPDIFESDDVVKSCPVILQFWKDNFSFNITHKEP